MFLVEAAELLGHGTGERRGPCEIVRLVRKRFKALSVCGVCGKCSSLRGCKVNILLLLLYVSVNSE